jgi:hypothetical protein
MAVVTVLGGNDPSQTQVQFTTEAAAAQAVVAALNAHMDEDQTYGSLDYTSAATIPGGAIGSQNFLHGVLGDSVNGADTQWLWNAAIQIPGTSTQARFLSSPFDVVRITGDAPAAVISTGPQTVIAGNAGIHYFYADGPSSNFGAVDVFAAGGGTNWLWSGPQVAAEYILDGNGTTDANYVDVAEGASTVNVFSGKTTVWTGLAGADTVQINLAGSDSTNPAIADIFMGLNHAHTAAGGAAAPVSLTLGGDAVANLYTTNGSLTTGVGVSVSITGVDNTFNDNGLGATISLTNGELDLTSPVQGSADFINASGSVTIWGGQVSGTDSVTGFLPTFAAGTGVDSVHMDTGWAGSATIFAGNASGQFTGGSDGSNVLVGGSGNQTLIGGTGSSGDVFAVGWTGGNGSTSISGNDNGNFIFLGDHNATIHGGAGADAYLDFGIASVAPGVTEEIQDFKLGMDVIGLVSSVTEGSVNYDGTNSLVTLSDGLTIKFDNLDLRSTDPTTIFTHLGTPT